MHIAIEGLDGVGKTTTAKKLAEVIGGVYFSKAFHFMKDSSGKYDNFTSLSECFSCSENVSSNYGTRSAFFYANYMDKMIVTERYYCTNYAANPCNETLTGIGLNIKLLGVPFITFILYCDYETNYQRMFKRNPNDKDFYKLKSHKEFYDNLIYCAEYFKLPYCVIDTTKLGLYEVTALMEQEIMAVLEKRRGNNDKKIIEEHTLILNSASDLLYNNNHKQSNHIHSIYIGKDVDDFKFPFFDDFLGLKQIVVDKDNAFFSSEDGVLFDKNKTTLLKMPQQYVEKKYKVPDGIKYIQYNAFRDSSLESIIFCDSCEEIGYNSFFNARNLKFIEFGTNLSKIGKNAFIGCKNIKYIKVKNECFNFFDLCLYDSSDNIVSAFNNPVKKIMAYRISAWAFACNQSIKNIICSKNVYRIGPYAFAGSSLETITINSSPEIHDYAFWDCLHLKSLKFMCKNPPRIAHELFYGIPYKIYIVVPKGCTDSFRKAFSNCLDDIIVCED